MANKTILEEWFERRFKKTPEQDPDYFEEWEMKLCLLQNWESTIEQFENMIKKHLEEKAQHK